MKTIDPIAALDAYRAQTDRLLKLADFASRMAPAFGETIAEDKELVDSVTPIALLRARNIAIQAALDAIADIARNS
jgi:hypothetical protein